MNMTLNDYFARCVSFVRSNILIILFLLLYIFFYQFWEDMIGKYMVDKFLCHFESNLISDDLFFIVVIGCLLHLGYITKNGYNPQFDIFIYQIIACIFWSYYRFVSQRFEFISLYTINYLKYLDIIPIYVFGKILFLYVHTGWFLWNHLNNKNRKYIDDEDEKYTIEDILGFNTIRYEGFIKDDPINENTGMDFRRKTYADNIVYRLLRTDTYNKAYAFGIDAPWGTGKTSLMNLMKGIIKNKEYIITIDFNPWIYSSDKNLMSAFMDELCGELKKYDSSLASNLIDYSKVLTAFDTKETKIVASIINLFHQKSTLEEKKIKIKNSLKSIKKIIFVFIDDLDRLDTDELLDMMKLIRNISEFPKIYIVAAYDKNYLVKCIENKIKTKGTNFVEKIFQHEFHLPPISLSTLQKILYDNIQNMIGYENKKLKEFIIDDDKHNSPLSLLTNIREVKRLANHFSQSYLQIGSGFRSKDLLLFELFKTKYPLVYSFFEQNKDKILELDKSSKRYILFQGENNGGKIDYIKFVENHKQELNVDEVDMCSIKTILQSLFSLETDNDDNLYYFNDVTWFNRYINLIETKIDISQKEFNDVMSKDFSTIKSKYKEWIICKSYSWGLHLLEYQTNDDKIKINLINSILYYSIYGKSVRIDNSNSIFYNSHIGERLRIEDSKVFKRLFQLTPTKWLYKDKESIIEILSLTDFNMLEIIRLSEVIFLFYKYKLVAKLLTYEDIIVIRDELIEKIQAHGILTYPLLIICYLTLLGAKICRDSSSVIKINSNIFLQQLRKAKKYKTNYKYLLSGYFSGGNLNLNIGIDVSDEYVKSLNTLMKNYFIYDIVNIVDAIIIPDNGGKYTIMHYIEFIWDEWENFYNSIVTLNNDNPKIIEFKAFLLKFRNRRYKSVNYDFIYIDTNHSFNKQEIIYMFSR